MTATQTSLDHHLGPLTTSLGNLHVTNNADEPDSTMSNSPIITTSQSQHSRDSSRASTGSSDTNRISQSNDRPQSRNDTRSSQTSTRGKLPDAADPEYSYVYVPPLSALQSTGSNVNSSKGDIESASMRSNLSGRSVSSNRSNFLDAGQRYTGRPRSTNAMAENQQPHRHASQERMGRQRDRTRSEEWADRGSAILLREQPNRNGGTTNRVIKKGVKDFQFGRTLGEGSYSTVVAATDRSTLKEYAIKMLDKRHIIKEKKVKYVNIEKNTLNRLGDHPGIVKLYFTFQDETTLYFVLDLAVNGELLGFIKKVSQN